MASEVEVGLMLQVRRCQLGLTQADVAQRSQLRQSRVSFLERNPGRATVTELLALCAALGLELSAKRVPVPAAARATRSSGSLEAHALGQGA